MGFEAATKQLEQIKPLPSKRPKKQPRRADTGLPESATAFDPASLLDVSVALDPGA